jgi:hypothetical protein
MQKNTMTKSFEQIQTTVLPKDVVRIISSLAREIRKSTKSHPLQPKQLESCYATLHMRIYQHYGSVSEDFMESARIELELLLTEDRPSLLFSNFRRVVSQRFL